jgi:predicted XRE-type DNA-binding protein
MDEEITVTGSVGNVFADLGFDNPEEEQLKAQLVREIRDILKGRRITQAKAAELLGLQQPDVSALVNGQATRFSIERLLRCIRRLDREVSIVITPSKNKEKATRNSTQAA